MGEYRLGWRELRLRQALEQLVKVDKPLNLSETGFPSAVGYPMENDHPVVAGNDTRCYGEALREFVERIRRVKEDYDGRIHALYFYEWRDNLYHANIWNVEQSPIHVAFGLCDGFGVPKFHLCGIDAALRSVHPNSSIQSMGSPVVSSRKRN
jgi:hypothetical protein